MFRVKENGNGSFNIFDSATGNLVMVITNNNNKENGRSKRVTTLSPTKSLQSSLSKRSTQLLTPINGGGHCLEELKGNGLSPSVNLPIVTICQPKATRRYSTRNPRNNNIAPVNSERSMVMNSKRKRKMEEFGDDIDDDDYYDCVDQDTFMKFFGLSSTKEPIRSVISLQKFKERLTVVTPTYTRNNVFDVDLCSNLGRSMVDNSQAVYAVSETPSSMVAKYEKYCQASSRRLGNWDVPFRQANTNYAVTYAPKMDWSRTHLYSFNRKQRLQRYKRIKTGLTKRSRFLLRLCKDVTIALKRVTNDEITSKCLLPLESIVESTTTPVTTSPVLYSPFGSRSPTMMSVCEYPCIDGTIVIEIDEVGSETVRVSQKPSKMINQQTGNPWLSPHSFSTGGSRSQSFMRPKRCHIKLDDVHKSPSRVIQSLLSSSPRLSATNQTNGGNGSDSDSDIEIIGMFPVVDGAKQQKCRPHVVRNLMNGLSDNNNKDFQSRNAASISINPLEFVATSYDASFRGKNTSGKTSITPLKQEQRDTVICSLNKFSPSKKLSVMRRAGRIDETNPSRLQSTLELENGNRNDFAEVCRSNGNNTKQRSNTQQLDLDMISRLVFLGRSTSNNTTNSDSAITRRASARNGDVSCVFKCHVCKCEELFKKNAVDSVYCHMVKHGGLSCTSLVSNLEEFEGYEVAILQAFPIVE